MGDVFPLAVDCNARLTVAPRQEVVITAVEYCIRRLRRRYTRRQRFIELVAIVTDADLKLDRCIYRADHRRIKKGGVQAEFTASQKYLNADA